MTRLISDDTTVNNADPSQMSQNLALHCFFFKRKFSFRSKGKDHKSNIMLKCLCNVDPLTQVKLGFIAVKIFSYFLLYNIDCGYPLEPPQ